MCYMPKSNDFRKGGGSSSSDGIPHTAADFQCFVCGAVFTTDEDRKHHLEKEAHGDLRDDTTEGEVRIA